MNLLREFLGTSMTVDDETLILLRLMGRPFAKPINVDLGEGADDVLCIYLREAINVDASTPFLNLIGKLLDPTYPPEAPDPGPLEAMFSRLEQHDRAAFAFQLIKLIEHAGAAVRPEVVRALNERFSPGPKIEGVTLSAFWHLLISRYSADVVRDEEIAVSRKTILDPAFCDGPVVATALQRPHLFFGMIVPILFEAIRSGDQKARYLPTIPPAMRAGFSALYREPREAPRRQSHMRLLSGQLEELMASGKGSFATEAALNGAAHAACQVRYRSGGAPRHSMPFAELALLEAGTSRGRARSNHISLGRRDGLSRILDTYVAPISAAIIASKADAVDPALVTNSIPYFEGIYLRIWQLLLQRAGLKVEMKEYRWGEVIPKLLEGELSFAVWNNYVAPQYVDEDAVVHRTEEPLLEYNSYPLVVRRDALERLLAQNLPEGDANALIGILTSDKPITPGKFKTCHGLRSALGTLKLGLVSNSDIEEIAHRALGDGFKGRAMESDKAVEELVDGRLDGAFLGGVQAYYLSQRFGSRTVTVTELQRTTHLHLWFNGRVYEDRKYPRFARPLLQAWRATCDIWDDAHDAPTDGRQALLRDWILGIASELNYGVTAAGVGMRTPISSWKMISRLSKKHNVRHRPETVVLQKRLTEDEFRIDPSAGTVKRMHMKEAANDTHLGERSAS